MRFPSYKFLFCVSLVLLTSACNESGFSSEAPTTEGVTSETVATTSAAKTCESSIQQDVVLLKNIVAAGGVQVPEVTDPTVPVTTECPQPDPDPVPDLPPQEEEPIVIPGCSESVIAKKLPDSTMMALFVRPNEMLESATWQSLVSVTGDQSDDITQGVTDLQGYLNALFLPLNTTIENIEHFAAGAFYKETPAPAMPEGCTYGDPDDMCPDDDLDDFKDARFMMGFSWIEPLAAESLTNFYQSLEAGPKQFTITAQGKTQILTAKQVSQASGVTVIEVNYTEDDPSIACADGALEGCAEVGCVLTADHVLCTDAGDVDVLKTVATGEGPSLQDLNLVTKLGCSNLDGIMNFKQFVKGMTNPRPQEEFVFSLLGTARLRSSFATTADAPWTVLAELNKSPTTQLVSTEVKIQSGLIPTLIEIMNYRPE